MDAVSEATVVREVNLTEIEVAYLDAETALRVEISRRAAELLQQAQALSKEAMALEDRAKTRAAECMARLAASHDVAGGFPSTCEILRRGDKVLFRWKEVAPAQAELGSADGDAPTPIDGIAILDKPPAEPEAEADPEFEPKAAEEARA